MLRMAVTFVPSELHKLCVLLQFTILSLLFDIYLSVICGTDSERSEDVILFGGSGNRGAYSSADFVSATSDSVQ